MNQLFKDEATNRQFEEKGYVIVPFLDQTGLDRLYSLYHKNVPEPVTGMICTNCYKPYEVNKAIYDEMTHVFSQRADEIFQDYQLFGGPFVVKSHVETFEMNLHQDWCFTEEAKVNSGFIWCPLRDTFKEEGGGIYVLDGSHQFFNNIRCGNSGYSSVQLSDELRQLLTPLQVRAGEALIMKHGVFHGSFPNQTDQIRITAMGTITAANTSLMYYRQTEQPEVIEAYQVSEEIFTKDIENVLHGGVPVSGTFHKTLHIEPFQPKNEDILAKMQQKLGITPKLPSSPTQEKSNVLPSLKKQTLSVFGRLKRLLGGSKLL